MEETIAYVYKWTYKPTYKWYIGSRTAKGCNPDDGYICSSKIVKPMIKSNPDEWIREIIATGKPEEMRELEAELLDLFDAKNDTRSFNMHNGDGKFTTAGKIHSDESRAKMSAAKKGKPGKPHNEEHRAKISASMKGIPKPQQIITCPHCNKSGGEPQMKQWHFNNCKFKDNING